MTGLFRCFAARRRSGRAAPACDDRAARRRAAQRVEDRGGEPPEPQAVPIAADQANSRDPAAAGSVGGRRLEARRGELDRSRPARSGRGARGLGEIKVGAYAQPVVHVIALDGRNPALRSRSLRRGLSYAVDRKGLLEDHLSKHPATDKDTVADGAFPKGSYADAPGVKPLESHPWLAKMLVAAARKELGRAADQAAISSIPRSPRCRRSCQKLADVVSRRRASRSRRSRSCPRGSKPSCGRAGGSTWLIACCAATSRSSMPGLLLCPGYDAPPEADALASAASPRDLAAPLAARARRGLADGPGSGDPDRSRVARRAAGDSALAARRPLRLARPLEGPGASPPASSIRESQHGRSRHGSPRIPGTRLETATRLCACRGSCLARGCWSLGRLRALCPEACDRAVSNSAPRPSRSSAGRTGSRSTWRSIRRRGSTTRSVPP